MIEDIDFVELVEYIRKNCYSMLKQIATPNNNDFLVHKCFEVLIHDYCKLNHDDIMPYVNIHEIYKTLIDLRAIILEFNFIDSEFGSIVVYVDNHRVVSLPQNEAFCNLVNKGLIGRDGMVHPAQAN